MIRKFKCAFCGKDIPPGRGFMYVRQDGSVLRFCGTKCKRSLVDFKRNPRKLKWTTKYEKKMI